MVDLYTVTKPDTVSDPSYSPDGGTVVFVEKIGATYKLSTFTDPVHTVLLSGSQAYADPYYSTDGTFILFTVQTGAVSGPEPYGEWAVHYMDADGGGDTTIVDDGNANLHPCWISPTQVAFQYWEYGVSSAFQIALIDLAGQGRRNLGAGEYPRGVEQ